MVDQPGRGGRLPARHFPSQVGNLKCQHVAMLGVCVQSVAHSLLLKFPLAFALHDFSSDPVSTWAKRR